MNYNKQSLDEHAAKYEKDLRNQSAWKKEEQNKIADNVQELKCEIEDWLTELKQFEFYEPAYQNLIEQIHQHDQEIEMHAIRYNHLKGD